MIEEIYATWWIPRRFAGYRPARVSATRVWKWLNQFPASERMLLLRLTRCVQYLSEKALATMLVRENEKLIKRLNFAGIPNERIIYVQYDDAGSSSAVTLNLLRDAGLLERKKFRWMDYKRVKDFHEMTTSLEEGAIIFVDDFVGSGTQFRKCHKFCSPFIVGNFSQFLLAGCICEEAFKVLDAQNVEPAAGIMHGRKDRPLSGLGSLFSKSEIETLKGICRRVANNSGSGLGFDDMASMVILYRNTPNNTPFAFRGTIGQDPFVGILPRTTDLISEQQAEAARNVPVELQEKRSS